MDQFLTWPTRKLAHPSWTRSEPG